MSPLQEAIVTADSGIHIADTPASLAQFLETETAAAIWRRQTPLDVQRWLNRLDPELLPKGRVALHPQAVADTINQLCDLSDLPIGPERDWLQNDITSLAAMFSQLLGAKFLRLRLDVITSNACRKFHVDAITARLICTYRGTGTQYGNSNNKRDPERVFTAQTGAPILLRGSLWPEIPSSGLRHRSPPIEGTGETRLVLVLDPLPDLENAE